MNDHGLLKRAAKSFYGDMIEAGVKVYEYQGRMAHQKVAVIDGTWPTAGSSNLDARSLEINDELNLVVLDEKFAKDIETRMFAEDLKQSRRITTFDPTRRHRANGRIRHVL